MEVIRGSFNTKKNGKINVENFQSTAAGLNQLS